jgi:hypothetical protein
MLFFLSSCDNSDEEILVEINADDIITMDILDDYMFRDDVQYVDLRNHEQLFHSGFIYSFENIPFFDYLDYRAFVRHGTYEFNPDQIINEEQLTRFFDRDKAIFLTADGCVRSGYIKDALNYLGYERVFVIGGFYEYEGEYKVLGDGYYSVGTAFFSYFTDTETNITYHIYGRYELDRHPLILHIDMFDNQGVSMRTDNYSEEIDYNLQLELLENAILQYGTNFNDIYGYFTDQEENNYNTIEGYTLGFSDGMLNAIKKLTAIR